MDFQAGNFGSGGNAWTFRPSGTAKLLSTRFSKSESAGCGRLFPCNTCTRDLFRWLRSDWQVFLHRLQSLALCSSDLVSSTGSPLGRLVGLVPGFVELDDAVQ